jgi:hypothetical protein
MKSVKFLGHEVTNEQVQEGIAILAANGHAADIADALSTEDGARTLKMAVVCMILNAQMEADGFKTVYREYRAFHGMEA